MYTTKTPIDNWLLNVAQLKYFFYIFCTRQISIKLVYLYQRRQCTDNYFFKFKFVLFFLFTALSIMKEKRPVVILSYYCQLLSELFSYSVVWCAIVLGPTARVLYLPRQHNRKTVLEGEDNNILST